MGKAGWLALIPCVLVWMGEIWAQAADPPTAVSENAAAGGAPEEVVVRGRRLADFRVELDAARVRVYELFNELNSDDAFDVHCRLEAGSRGTRMRRQACRPQFANDISADAASAWVYALMDACHSDMSQDCIFGHAGAASQAKLAAQAEEGREPAMQQKFALEMAQVVADHPQMQEAMLEFLAVERAYDEARGAPRCDVPDPPARCAR